MREIKFRAWNKDTKIMIDLQKITPFALNDPGQFGLFLPFEKEIPIMQSTGLKDKNGKEIFEGDICTSMIQMWNEIGIVEWVKTKATFGWRQKNDTIWYELDTIEPLEIIGNIYENPELITQEGEKDA